MSEIAWCGMSSDFIHGRISKDEFARMDRCAEKEIREHHAFLSELDSVGGDGDHGTTMLRALEQIEKAFASGCDSDLKTSLHDAGWNVLAVDGGASTLLLGVFFLGLAESSVIGPSLGTIEIAAGFEAGLSAVRRLTNAQLGDKTMIDALVPAIGALRESAAAGMCPREAFRAASAAAEAGSEMTKALSARHGRAKFLGDKTRGFQDPGAASIALIFAGFYRGLLDTALEV